MKLVWWIKKKGFFLKSPSILEFIVVMIVIIIIAIVDVDIVVIIILKLIFTCFSHVHPGFLFLFADMTKLASLGNRVCMSIRCSKFSFSTILQYILSYIGCIFIKDRSTAEKLCGKRHFSDFAATKLPFCVFCKW